MFGRSSGNHDWLLANATLAFLAVFVYATQAIAFEGKPGFRYRLICPHSTWKTKKALIRVHISTEKCRHVADYADWGATKNFRGQ